MYTYHNDRLECVLTTFDQLSFPAPPLTLNNVLKVVKDVRDWRPLCRAMLWTKPEDIQSQHGSHEECLKAVLKRFLQSKKRSWREVIWSLYEAKEIQLAEQVKSYAEKVQGTIVVVLNM